MSRDELICLIRLATRLGLTPGEVFRLIGDPQRISFEEARALVLHHARTQRRQAGPGIGM